MKKWGGSMNRIDKLVESYGKFVSIPWQDDAAAAQRVIFCIYDENNELMLRAKMGEFELITRQAGHEWVLYDLTDTFAEWLMGQAYAEKYFEQPQLITPLLQKYLEFLKGSMLAFIDGVMNERGAVVAIMGTGSLYGLLKVKDIVDMMAPLVKGRLLVFFPGTFENNNYRLLNGYDGWNYMAVPVTADSQF